MREALLDIARTVAPTSLPVTLDEAKTHLRVDADDEDTRITGLITSATGWLDGYDGILGRSILTQTYQLYLPAFGRWLRRGDRIYRDPTVAAIDLPAGPLQSVSSVTYVDINGVTQTLNAGVDFIVLDGRRSQIVPAVGTQWPEVQDSNPRAVTITYVAGFADDAPSLDAVAPNLRQGILLLVGHWFKNHEAVVGVDNRDSSTEMPISISALIAPYRVIPV